MKKPAVLIIDDNVFSVDMTAELLESAGFSVRIAYESHTGTQQALREKPDLILLDLHLPDVKSVELAESLRLEMEGNPLNILAFTAERHNREEKSMLLKHFDGIVEKPIDIETFPQLIRTFLQESSQQYSPIESSFPTRSILTTSAFGALQLCESLLRHDLKALLCNVQLGLKILASENQTIQREELFREIQNVNDEALWTLDKLQTLIALEEKSESVRLSLHPLDTFMVGLQETLGLSIRLPDHGLYKETNLLLDSRLILMLFKIVANFSGIAADTQGLKNVCLSFKDEKVCFKWTVQVVNPGFNQFASLLKNPEMLSEHYHNNALIGLDWTVGSIIATLHGGNLTLWEQQEKQGLEIVLPIQSCSP
jgi:DNA-binding response OmpR family regulator